MMNQNVIKEHSYTQSHNVALKNIVQSFIHNVQTLYSSRNIQLPLKKSQIFIKVFQLFENQFKLQQPQSESSHPFKMLNQDSQNLKKLDVLDFQVKLELCQPNNKLQDKEVSQSSKCSKRSVNIKSVTDHESGSIYEINLLQNNEVPQKTFKKLKFKKNPYANMNQDIDMNQTYFINSKQNNSQQQFEVQLQIQQQSSVVAKIQPEQEQQSFNIEEYQNSQDDQSSKKEQVRVLRKKRKLISKNDKNQKNKNVKDQYKNSCFTQKKHYRSYTQEEKKQTLSKVKLFGIEQTSKMENIPKKNIIRWIKKAQQNNFCRGRKPVNPFMQIQLTKWIKSNIKDQIYVTQSDIRYKARQLSGQINFKASKGWLQKYFRRHATIGLQLSRLLTLKRIQKALPNQFIKIQ